MPKAHTSADLDLIEGADLLFCERCEQLTLHTTDEVLEVWTDCQESEVVVRCLSCEDYRVKLAPHY